MKGSVKNEQHVTLSEEPAQDTNRPDKSRITYIRTVSDHETFEIRVK
jgi:hypothetical protein